MQWPRFLCDSTRRFGLDILGLSVLRALRAKAIFCSFCTSSFKNFLKLSKGLECDDSFLKSSKNLPDSMTMSIVPVYCVRMRLNYNNNFTGYYKISYMTSIKNVKQSKYSHKGNYKHLYGAVK